MQYLENEFRENKDNTFEEFTLKNKAILDNYRVGLDNYLMIFSLL